jgi:hypothetical protein
MSTKAEMERVLRKIATMPLSQDFETGDRGRIKNGAMSWGPAWAAWHFQELARSVLPLQDRGEVRS